MDNKMKIQHALNNQKYGLYMNNMPKVIRSNLQRKTRLLSKQKDTFTSFSVTETKDVSILLTGGIGDVLALESFFNEDMRQKLNHIFYATRSADPLINIFQKVYPQCSHTKVWEDFNRFFCFYSKNGVKQSLIKANKNVPANWSLIHDWSIGIRFPRCTQYNSSMILKTKLAEIKPPVQNYYVIVPYSPNDQRDPNRKITTSEWEKVINYLERNQIKGIIINSGAFDFNHERVINLSGQTSILESIEYVKQSKGYIGVDSALSVIAAKVLPNESIKIKSNNIHLMNHKHVYYAPKTNFNFIYSNLLSI